MRYVRAGENQSFVLLADGSLFGWGENGKEQLGLPTGDVSTPTAIAISGGVRDVAGARDHGIAIDAAGAFHGWGQNQAGAQGTGFTTASATPALTYGPAGLKPTRIWAAKEDYSFIQLSDATVWGVGRGFIQAGNIQGRASPVRVVPLMGTSVAQIAAGSNHTIILDTAGAVWGIGQNSNGRLGATPLHTCSPSGTKCNRLPQQVCDVGSDFASCTVNGDSLGAVDEIAVGASHTLLRRGDQVLAFGDRSQGQLGNNTWGSPGYSVPINVPNTTDTGPLTGIAWLAAGAQTSFAGATDGTIYSWGGNGSGQMALDPTTTKCSNISCRPLPTVVAALAGVKVTALSVGSAHVLALDDAGAIWSWGSTDEGQLGRLGFITGTSGGRISFEPARITLLPR